MSNHGHIGFGTRYIHIVPKNGFVVPLLKNRGRHHSLILEILIAQIDIEPLYVRYQLPSERTPWLHVGFFLRQILHLSM